MQTKQFHGIFREQQTNGCRSIGREKQVTETNQNWGNLLTHNMNQRQLLNLKWSEAQKQNYGTKKMTKNTMLNILQKNP